MDSENAQQESKSMNETQRTEIKEKLGEVNRQLMTMDWDKKHNQFNPGMESKYEHLKSEQSTLKKKLDQG